jgi:hypothetical protein
MKECVGPTEMKLTLGYMQHCHVRAVAAHEGDSKTQFEIFTNVNKIRESHGSDYEECVS